MIQVETFAAWKFQLVGIEAEAVEDSGVNVSDIMTVFDGVETEFVGGAMLDPWFDASAGEPRAEALGMMIATCAFSARRTSEFCSKNDESVF